MFPIPKNCLVRRWSSDPCGEPISSLPEGCEPRPPATSREVIDEVRRRVAPPAVRPEADYYRTSYSSFEPELERLTHLVLVDGRLVDMWSEPVSGTRWRHHAERSTAGVGRSPRRLAPRRCTRRSSSGSTPLSAVASALDLHDGPLVDDGFEPDPDLSAARRELLATTVDLLDRAALELRVREARAVLTNTLREVWNVDREGVLDLGTASRLAGGICWVAAKANALLGPGGSTTQTALQRVVECRTQLSVPGRTLRRLLAGHWPEPQLIRARDQALAAQAVVAADDTVTADVTPS